MGGELTLQGSIKFAKAGITFEEIIPSRFFDVAGSIGNQQAQTIGITDEVLVLGDVSSIGYVAVINTDLTNSVQIGSDGTLYPVILRANFGWAIMEWNAAAIHAKANVAPCVIEFLIIAK